MARRWLQIRSDPAVTQLLFEQPRVNSEFDAHLDEVLERVESLLVYRGIFHAKIHFSSGQVTLWSMVDPYNYQVCLKEEFLDGDFLDYFRPASYPINAIVPPDHVREILNIIRTLRCRDDANYLRSGSLNIINGMVGLVFSRDGAHYLDYLDFIRHGNDL